MHPNWTFHKILLKIQSRFEFSGFSHYVHISVHKLVIFLLRVSQQIM